MSVLVFKQRLEFEGLHTHSNVVRKVSPGHVNNSVVFCGFFCIRGPQMVTACLKTEALIKYLQSDLFLFSAYLLFLLPTCFFFFNPFCRHMIHTQKLIEMLHGLLNAAK